MIESLVTPLGWVAVGSFGALALALVLSGQPAKGIGIGCLTVANYIFFMLLH